MLIETTNTIKIEAVTVKDLREWLTNQDDDAVVVLMPWPASHNSSPLRDMYTGAMKMVSHTKCETGLTELTEANKRQGFTDEDVITDGVKCVILGPYSG